MKQVLIYILLFTVAVIFAKFYFEDECERDAGKVASLYCSIHKLTDKNSFNASILEQSRTIYENAAELEEQYELKYRSRNELERFVSALANAMSKCD